VYKDLPIEVAEQRFKALQEPTLPKEGVEIKEAPPKEKKVRKLKPKKEVK
jgi:hypothetical protein